LLPTLGALPVFGLLQEVVARRDPWRAARSHQERKEEAMLDRDLHLRGAAVAASLTLAAIVMGGLAACGGDQETQYAANAPVRQAPPTPMDQGTGVGDTAITDHIKKSVEGNKALSTSAHNVKIVAQNGVVTLRGAVNTAQEKEAILEAAESAPGVRRVDDQLDLKGED
jgi:osmotically-inducible protein OsmY